VSYRLGTLNVNGLQGKEEELGKIGVAMGMDFLALQETFLREGRNVFVPGFKWFGRPSTLVPGRRGVGFLVNLNLGPKCNACHPLPKYEGLLVLQFRRPRAAPLFLVCFYSPTNDDPLATRREAYKELSSTALHYGLMGQVIVLGDFNAHVRPGMEGGVQGLNSNGTLMAEALSATGLQVANLVVEGAYPPTYFSPSAQTAIDFILVDRDLDLAGGWATVEEVDTTSSDHLLLHLQVSLPKARRSKEGEPRTVWDTHKLVPDYIRSWDEEVQDYRTDTVLSPETLALEGHLRDHMHAWIEQGARRIQALLQDPNLGPEAPGKWLEEWTDRLLGIYKTGLDNCVGRISFRQLRNSWWDGELDQAARTRRDRLQAFRKEPSGEAWQEFLEARKAVSTLGNRKKKQWWVKENAALYDQLLNDPRRAWKRCNRMCGRSSPHQGLPIRSKDGQVTADPRPARRCGRSTSRSS
jgi:hypothetical protein